MTFWSEKLGPLRLFEADHVLRVVSDIPLADNWQHLTYQSRLSGIHDERIYFGCTHEHQNFVLIVLPLRDHERYRQAMEWYLELEQIQLHQFRIYRNQMRASAYGQCDRGRHCWILRYGDYGVPLQSLKADLEIGVHYLLQHGLGLILSFMYSRPLPEQFQPTTTVETQLQDIRRMIKQMRYEIRSLVALDQFERFLNQHESTFLNQKLSPVFGQSFPHIFRVSHVYQIYLTHLMNFEAGYPFQDLFSIIQHGQRVSPHWRLQILSSYFCYEPPAAFFVVAGICEMNQLMERYLAISHRDKESRRAVANQIRQLSKDHDKFTAVVPRWYRHYELAQKRSLNKRFALRRSLQMMSDTYRAQQKPLQVAEHDPESALDN